MTESVDLLGKTFDQQLQVASDAIVDFDITPNCRIPVTVTFEPIARTQVRVTAHDKQGKLLFENKVRMTEDAPPPKEYKRRSDFRTRLGWSPSNRTRREPQASLGIHWIEGDGQPDSLFGSRL